MKLFINIVCIRPINVTRIKVVRFNLHKRIASYTDLKLFILEELVVKKSQSKDCAGEE